MELRKASLTALEAAVGAANTDHEDNIQLEAKQASQGLIRFTLRVHNSSGKGAHLSASGRRTVSACWHVHRDVMQALFSAHPQASIASGLAKYRNGEDFLANFGRTYYANAGSQARPVAYGTLCLCDSEEKRATINSHMDTGLSLA